MFDYEGLDNQNQHKQTDVVTYSDRSPIDLSQEHVLNRPVLLYCE